MPELPEVETVVRILNTFVPNKTIKDIVVYREKSIPLPVSEFKNALIGETFLPTTRIGKHIIFHLTNNKVIVSHLRMEGKYFEVVFEDWCQEFPGACIISGHKERLSDMTKEEWIELGELEKELEILAELTDGYSGSDIATLTRDAVYEPLRKCEMADFFKKVDDGKGDYYYYPCEANEPGAFRTKLQDLPEPEKLNPPKVTFEDYLVAIQKIKATVTEADLKKNDEFTAEFGQEG